MNVVYENIRQLLTLEGVRAKGGRDVTVKDLGVIDDAAVAIEGEIVAWVGPRKQVPDTYSQAKRISAENAVWLPAMVECHTHLIYGGSRVRDYAERCSGKTYQDIAKAGGGILSTVQATREASKDLLTARAMEDLAPFRSRGVACLEIKSGYGLTLESEIKMLECIQALQEKTSLTLIPTFLPAHAVPPEFKGKTDAYVDVICREWIPEIAKRQLALFFDAFVEDGYFNVAQTRKMAKVAQDHGLKVKLHADQFTNSGGALLGVELGATSCDHLDSVSSGAIKTLAQSDTVSVLAPGASVFTGTPFPPARALLDAGAIVALSTDFNPGTCPSRNLPLMLTLACSQMKMTIPEALAAVTYNAAVALSVQDGFGTIEAGRHFQVASLPIQSYEELAYRYGEI